MPSLKDEILLTLTSGAIYLLNPYELFRFGEDYQTRSIYTLIDRLNKKGLLRKSRKEKKLHLELTEKGKKYLEKHFMGSAESRPPWDGKWRMIIFDIPEEKKRSRNLLRRYLNALGFGKVQRSVWISPLDLTAQTVSYVKKLQLSDYVFQFIIQNFQGLSNSELVRKFWRLDKINDKYLRLIKEYSRKLTRLDEASEASSDYDKQFICRALLAKLKWDYQSILNSDPQLPEELLPADWAGKTARRFIAEHQKIHAENR